MAKTVYFFGAGLSKTFGFPITSEILPKIVQGIIQYRQRKKTWLFPEDPNNQERYLSLLQLLISRLSPGIKWIFEVSDISLTKLKDVKMPLVTNLLSQLDHLIVSGQDIYDWNFSSDQTSAKIISDITERVDLKDMKSIFEWAIISAIGTKEPHAIKSLDPFFKYIKRNNTNHPEKFITTITSNYDNLLEWNFLEDGEANEAADLIDYGFSWREPVENDDVYLRPSKPTYQILKLHDSFDWLKCDGCGHIYVNTAYSLYVHAYSNIKEGRNSCHCGYWPLKPVIVPPSYIRNTFDTNLHEIWKTSLEVLRKADEWVIVGYSLPEEDFNIKSLFLRAFHGAAKKPKITVVQRGNWSRNNFYNFFGKEHVAYSAGGFQRYVTAMKKSKKRTKPAR